MAAYRNRLFNMSIPKTNAEKVSSPFLETQESKLLALGDETAVNFRQSQAEGAARGIELLNPAVGSKGYDSAIEGMVKKFTDFETVFKNTLDTMSPEKSLYDTSGAAAEKLFKLYDEAVQAKNSLFSQIVRDGKKTIGAPLQSKLSSLKLSDYDKTVIGKASFVSDFMNAPKKVIGEDYVDSMVKQLSDEINVAYRAGRGNEAKSLIKVRDAVEDFQDEIIAQNPKAKAVMEKLNPILSDYHEMLGKTKANFGGKRLTDTIAKKQIDLFNRGDAKAKEKMLDNFMADTTSVKSFQQVFKNTPEDAVNYADQYLKSKLGDKIGFLTKSTPQQIDAAFNSLNKQHKHVFDMFPTLKTSFDEARTKIKGMGTNMGDIRSYIQNMVNDKSLEISGRSFKEVMEGLPTAYKETMQGQVKSALDSGDLRQIKTLKSFFKTPAEADDAVAQMAFDGLLDNVLVRQGTDAGKRVSTAKSSKIYDTILSNPESRKAYEEILGKEKVQLFLESAEAADGVVKMLRNTKRLPNQSITGQTNIDVAEFKSAIVNLGRGFQNMRAAGVGNLGLMLLNRYFKDIGAKQKAMARMVFDKEFFEETLKKGIEGVDAKTLDTIRSTLLEDSLSTLNKAGGRLGAPYVVQDQNSKPLKITVGPENAKTPEVNLPKGSGSYLDISQ
jgi:inorganic triphosphatase YgiF